LKELEKMMKAREPERDWSFMDRNFVETIDATTLRQTISEYCKLGTDVQAEYYGKEDALILAVYFKNPPGRLLRRQWTSPIRVFPEFHLWRDFLKKEQVDLPEKYLAVDSSKVGVLKENLKYAFPCDNSIIRIDKCEIGGRRVGKSLIVKDNLIMGVRERADRFTENAGGDENLISREGRQDKDSRCEMWMVFENETRMLLEMQDKQTLPLQEIPPMEQVPDLEEGIDETSQPHPENQEDVGDDQASQGAS
jgi:hypothetical protein